MIEKAKMDAKNSEQCMNVSKLPLLPSQILWGILDWDNLSVDQINDIGWCLAAPGQPFSIILDDINNFKGLNDRFGHETGDHILVGIAELLQSRLRVQDRVSRWGGEEFLVLLPGASQMVAQQVADRLCETIAAARIVVEDGENRINMTFGVAACSGCLNMKECIRNADLAMYEGKRKGRNCVVVHTCWIYNRWFYPIQRQEKRSRATL